MIEAIAIALNLPAILNQGKFDVNSVVLPRSGKERPFLPLPWSGVSGAVIHT